MSAVFDPDSIAVIGASSDSDRIAGRPIAFLQKHGYEGRIYPVNPNHDELAGLKCYPDVEALPESPDFAMVILPARLVVDVVEDCVDAGVDTVLVVSSGFSETGDEEAEAAERRLAELAAESDTTLVGPNSQGMIDFPSRATASFTPALRRDELLVGPVSFVSQSGAFGGALTTLLQDAGVGLDRWVSTGNEAAMESLDFASLLAETESTEIVAGYLEAFEDGRKLVELKRTDAGIELPLVVLKAGRSERGKAAAASHTGKIAGRHAVYEGVFDETGVVDVDDIDEFVDAVRTLATLSADPGPRLGVLTTSGGAGSHIADVVEEEPAIQLPELTGEIRDTLDEHVPPYGATFNPVDVTGQVVNSPESFRECLQTLLSADGIDTVVLQSTNASGERALGYAETVVEIADDSETPLFVVWTGGVDKEPALEVYDEAGIPVFENPARCIRTVASIVEFARSKDRLREAASLPARPPTYDGDAEDAPSMLSEPDAKALFAEHGLAVPEGRLVESSSEAESVAETLDTPLVAKLISPDVAHRDRIGGIRLDLETLADVADAVEELLAVGARRDLEVTGVSVQEQIADGLELAAGIVTDTDFGPVVMLGRGGVDVETIADATFRTIPLARPHAESMLSDLETVATDELTATQRESIVESLLSLSEAYLENPWIEEADVNPLVVGDDGVVAVDALVVGPGG